MFKAKSGAFTFPIGKLTISVGFTPSHYCSNQAYTAPTQLVTSKNAEIAIITKKGKFITNKFFDCGHDQVAGWVAPKEFAKGLQKIITFTQIRKKPTTNADDTTNNNKPVTQDEALRQIRTLANNNNIVFVAWTATDVIDLHNSLNSEEKTQKPLEEEDANSILDNCAKWLEEIMIERGWQVIQYELDSWLKTKTDG